MTAVFHRAPRARLPVAVGGQGAFLVDADGRRYLDASGGAAVSCLGHGHPAVVEAIVAQARALAYAHTAFFTNEPSERLAAFLVERAPDGIGKVYFVSGGSDATETALKLARSYHVARGDVERHIFFARRQSYHGNTLGALSVSGNPGRRAAYEPLLTPARFIEPCYAYRGRQAEETAEAYGRRAANALEEAILEAGPERAAAFIAEPVVGATLGAVPAEPGYLACIREICDRYGLLFIADEVMCGMGRTGTLFAAEQDGVAPDIVTCAKGLGGGYQPIGAALVSTKVHDTIIDGLGRFEHGHTYVGHPIACAAALAVQETIEAEGLLATIQDKGARLRDLLAERLRTTGVLGDVRGRGLLIGVELVADPRTKEPFPAKAKLSARVKEAAMAGGLAVYPGSGCVDGARGDHILIAPPYIVGEEHLALIAEGVGRAVEQVLAAVAA